MIIEALIVETASEYIGVKEIPKNKGWEDKAFQKAMEQVGWYSGYAWCMLFAELVWSQSYFNTGRSDIVSQLSKLFSASVISTWHSAKKSDLFEIGYIPQVGAIMIMQRYRGGKGTKWGHAGIVNKVIDNVHFTAIEGNTSVVGKVREGDTVAINKRTIHVIPEGSKDGNYVIGFIYPKIP